MERAAGVQCPALEGLDQDLLGQVMLAGQCEAIQRLRRQIQIMGPHLRDVFVESEEGLGAELLAHELHRLSGSHAGAPWTVDVGAASAADKLDGAASQASVLVRGLQRAPVALQHRLLRAMQDSRAARVPTRWIVLSELGAKTLAADGVFLPELARALPVLALRIPPVRERHGDIGPIAATMLDLLGFGSALDRAAVEVLETHRWPGNLLEMIQSLRIWRAGQDRSSAELARLLLSRRSRPAAVEPATETLPEAEPLLLQSVINLHLLRIMRRCGGNKLRAAEVLGISRSTLYRMLDAIAGAEQQRTT